MAILWMYSLKFDMFKNNQISERPSPFSLGLKVYANQKSGKTKW